MEQSYIISNLTIQLLCSNIFIMQSPMGVVFVVNFEGTNQISLAHVCFLSKSANRHTKTKKPSGHFIIKIFLVENECKTPIGYLTFIFYRKYFLR